MADFDQFAKDKNISRLLVDLGDGVIDLQRSKRTYINEGSLTNPAIASWIRSHKAEDSRNLFLFELDITDSNHTYRLLGSEHDIVRLFVNHWD